MRTQIRYKNGEVQTYNDAAPSIDSQVKELILVDSVMNTIGDPIPFGEIEKVVFVP